MQECIFCNIINKKINSNIIFENEKVLLFSDIHPQAPVHFLAISKKHFPSINELEQNDFEIVSEIFKAITYISKKYNFEKNGYRVVYNKGNAAGQAVEHIHFHILAGRQLSWPPG